MDVSSGFPANPLKCDILLTRSDQRNVARVVDPPDPGCAVKIKFSVAQVRAGDDGTDVAPRRDGRLLVGLRKPASENCLCQVSSSRQLPRSVLTCSSKETSFGPATAVGVTA